MVAATGQKKVYKKTIKQPRGQAKQAQRGKIGTACVNRFCALPRDTP